MTRRGFKYSRAKEMPEKREEYQELARYTPKIQSKKEKPIGRSDNRHTVFQDQTTDTRESKEADTD